MTDKYKIMNSKFPIFSEMAKEREKTQIPITKLASTQKQNIKNVIVWCATVFVMNILNHFAGILEKTF